MEVLDKFSTENPIEDLRILRKRKDGETFSIKGGDPFSFQHQSGTLNVLFRSRKLAVLRLTEDKKKIEISYFKTTPDVAKSRIEEFLSGFSTALSNASNAIVAAQERLNAKAYDLIGDPDSSKPREELTEEWALRGVQALFYPGML